MNAILLCAAMFAADQPAQVQARGVDGTAAKQPHRADQDLWSSTAVAKAGSPLAQPPLEGEVGRKESRVRFSVEGETTIIDIVSEFGIDKAIIRRSSQKWPKSILVRLHLSGLELFRVNNGEYAIDWSVASTGENSSRVSLRKGADETPLDTDSPYYSSADIVGGNRKIPLKDGYFEVRLPAKLFEGNSEQITLQWIDFYRN